MKWIYIYLGFAFYCFFLSSCKNEKSEAPRKHNFPGKSTIATQSNSSHLETPLLPFKTDIESRLQNGRIQFRKCQVCHTLQKGAPNRAGPNLYDLFNRRVASLENFTYSKALEKADFLWTEEKLDAWLKNPNAFLPNNRMAFIGIRKEQNRKDIILFLKKATLSTPPVSKRRKQEQP